MRALIAILSMLRILERSTLLCVVCVCGGGGGGVCVCGLASYMLYIHIHVLCMYAYTYSTYTWVVCTVRVHSTVGYNNNACDCYSPIASFSISFQRSRDALTSAHLCPVVKRKRHLVNL